MLATLTLAREDMHFSAGHFTVFSPTKREPLHGHCFFVEAKITAEVTENGMTTDYAVYKKKLRALCRSLGQIFLLPGESPYLTIQHDNDYIWVHFNEEKIPFLTRDIKILPIRNITVEELSRWFVLQLTQDEAFLVAHRVHGLEIGVFSGPGQGAWSSWTRA